MPSTAFKFGPKAQEKAARQARVADLIAMGYDRPTEIARRLGVTGDATFITTIWRDIQAINKEYGKKLAAKKDSHVNRVVASMNHKKTMFAEMYLKFETAYKESQKPKEKTRTRKRSASGAESNEASLEVEKRDGDIRCYQGMLSCIEGMKGCDEVIAKCLGIYTGHQNAMESAWLMPFEEALVLARRLGLRTIMDEPPDPRSEPPKQIELIEAQEQTILNMPAPDSVPDDVRRGLDALRKLQGEGDEHGRQAPG